MIAKEAETSVLSQMLARPTVIAEVAGTMLVGEHFEDPAMRVLYETVVEQFYADEGTDALTVAALLSPRLTRLWHVSEDEVVDRVRKLAQALPDGRAADHATIVQRGAKLRRLATLAAGIDRGVKEGKDPEEIAGLISLEALAIVSDGSERGREIVTFDQAGENFLAYAKAAMAANQAGRSLGVKTGIRAIDAMTEGILPTELLIGAGEPGVGKSILWWIAARNFAMEQAKMEPHRRVGTLVASLEMGEVPSNTRLAQMISGVPTAKLRSGGMTGRELEQVMQAWQNRTGLPLYFNHAGRPKASQLRAIVSESIRKHNVGFVVIDHFRLFDMDKKPRHEIEHDEERALFLKEQIAKDLNVAVVCLAHTRKLEAGVKPTMADLRGSGQISAYSDFVTFLHRDALHATEQQIDRGQVDLTAAEVIWGKNRHNASGISALYFDPSHMHVH